MKCSDLNNPTKPLEISLEWSVRIMEEFYRQGDQEKEAGLPVSNFMSRSDSNIAKCQIAFMDLLVNPLFTAWDSYSNNEETKAILKNLNINRAYWSGNPSASTHSLAVSTEIAIRKHNSSFSMSSANHSTHSVNSSKSQHSRMGSSSGLGAFGKKRYSFRSTAESTSSLQNAASASSGAHNANAAPTSKRIQRINMIGSTSSLSPSQTLDVVSTYLKSEGNIVGGNSSIVMTDDDSLQKETPGHSGPTHQTLSEDGEESGKVQSRDILQVESEEQDLKNEANDQFDESFSAPWRKRSKSGNS
jgi:hypothetical protein